MGVVPTVFAGSLGLLLRERFWVFHAKSIRPSSYFLPLCLLFCFINESQSQTELDTGDARHPSVRPKQKTKDFSVLLAIFVLCVCFLVSLQYLP